VEALPVNKRPINLGRKQGGRNSRTEKGEGEERRGRGGERERGRGGEPHNHYFMNFGTCCDSPVPSSEHYRHLHSYV
jgi:hypothetical protein